jgi:ComF family protein
MRRLAFHQRNRQHWPDSLGETQARHRDAVAMHSFIQSLIPHSCVFCGDVKDNLCVCLRCIGMLPWNDVICNRCGQPVVSELPAGVLCAACQQRLPAYSKARSPFHYAFPVDTSLKAMKFRRNLIYAPAFAFLLHPAIRSEFSECDALVPVPLHRWRHFRRGFNQSAELCRELAVLTGLQLVNNAIRIRATRTQSGLTSAMRKKNLRGAFAIQGKPDAKYPLIVDDVITTGATCEHLAMALLDAGAEKVAVLTVARSSHLQ